MSLLESEIFFRKRAGSVSVSAMKHYLKRVGLVDIETILSKTFEIIFSS